MKSKPHKYHWTEVGTQFGENLPPEGWTVLAMLKAGAVLRVEDVPNLPENRKAGQRFEIVKEFCAFGYRYGKNRFYLPLFRCSCNLRESVMMWEPTSYKSEKYNNGKGREGEEHMLSAQE